VCDGVFTHYKREEDASMQRRKLDEELARMSEIAGLIRPHLPAAVQRVARAHHRERGGARPLTQHA
jgi:hypothetical protein